MLENSIQEFESKTEITPEDDVFFSLGTFTQWLMAIWDRLCKEGIKKPDVIVAFTFVNNEIKHDRFLMDTVDLAEERTYKHGFFLVVNLKAIWAKIDKLDEGGRQSQHKAYKETFEGKEIIKSAKEAMGITSAECLRRGDWS